ncbi:UNVERIFIED_CONTAM: hypothetical protein K2H54_020441 [Gekko kuhli]
MAWFGFFFWDLTSVTPDFVASVPQWWLKRKHVHATTLQERRLEQGFRNSKPVRSFLPERSPNLSQWPQKEGGVFSHRTWNVECPLCRTNGPGAEGTLELLKPNERQLCLERDNP